jgi:hypothetical protein
MKNELQDQELTPEFMEGHIELIHNMILGHMANHNLTEWVVEPPINGVFTGCLEFIKRPREEDDYVNLVARMVYKTDD